MTGTNVPRRFIVWVEARDHSAAGRIWCTVIYSKCANVSQWRFMCIWWHATRRQVYKSTFLCYILKARSNFDSGTVYFKTFRSFCQFLRTSPSILFWNSFNRFIQMYSPFTTFKHFKVWQFLDHCVMICSRFHFCNQASCTLTLWYVIWQHFITSRVIKFVTLIILQRC